MFGWKCQMEMVSSRLFFNWRLVLLALHEKCLNTEFFSGPYFPAFSPNTGKYGPEKPPHLGNFHAVFFLPKTKSYF